MGRPKIDVEREPFTTSIQTDILDQIRILVRILAIARRCSINVIIEELFSQYIAENE
ncbi:hypothetical protein [Clostridium grantii]|uniref:Uncharacterized protein n=1 Tax=Clostridium grantii DSM 8605 TaxID=1121316 RepID=A0A1M5SDX7_9CLOT|nr:hypothetical protein [Clostridium grantii]SHH36671.1 hypothetical protein SAMN02745207_00885 [Clostridium grantii DSM 8605]